MIESREFDRTDAVRPYRIYPDDLARRSGKYVLTFRGSMTRDFEQADLGGAHCVWSMWPGYLDDASGERLRAWLAERHIPLTVLHSSGHATVTDLQRFAAALHADHVIPIHTRVPELYEGLFANVEQRRDGEWWEP